MSKITANDIRDEIDARIDEGTLKPLQSMQAAKFSNNDIDNLIGEVVVELEQDVNFAHKNREYFDTETINRVIDKVTVSDKKKKK